MNNLAETFLYYTSGVTTASTIMGLLASIIVPIQDRWNKRFFTTFFSLLAAGFLIELLEPFLPKTTESLPARLLIWWTSTFPVVTLLPMMTAYQLHCCKEGVRGNPVFRRALIAWSVTMASMTASLWFPDLCCTYTPEQGFVYGPYYFHFFFPITLPAAINLQVLFQRWHQFPRRQRLAIASFLVPLPFVLLYHMIFHSFSLVYVCLTTFALAMFVIILFDQTDQYLQQQREIAHQEASIAVLKMRPHFIYNTMTSIYYLCDQNPAKAQQVTLDFMTYLRKNLAAIVSEDPIPFTEELEHTRAYLAVEQAQYAEMLQVTYDTPHTNFKVPPLTLQPLVENAVKHGIDPDAHPLHVTVQTRESDGHSIVSITDDGPGFDCDAVLEDQDTTLANVRQRLHMMHGSTLELHSDEGMGTTATITIA